MVPGSVEAFGGEDAFLLIGHGPDGGPTTASQVEVGTSDDIQEEPAQEIAEVAQANVAAVQVSEDHWVTFGRTCPNIESVEDFDGCEPGLVTVSILSATGDVEQLTNVPERLGLRGTAIRGASDDGVLFEAREDGRSDYWVLDLESTSFEPVPHEVSPLPSSIPREPMTVIEVPPMPSSIPREPVTATELHAARTSCLYRDQLLVLDSVPNGSRLSVTLRTSPIDGGVTQVADLGQDGIGTDWIPGRLMCIRPDAPVLALYESSSDTAAVAILDAARGDVLSISPAPTSDPTLSFGYGHGVITSQTRDLDRPPTPPNYPDDPDHSDQPLRAPELPEIEEAVFVTTGREWQRLGEYNSSAEVMASGDGRSVWSSTTRAASVGYSAEPVEGRFHCLRPLSRSCRMGAHPGRPGSG